MNAVVRQVEMRQGREGGEDEGMENLEVVEAQIKSDKIVNGQLDVILSCSCQRLDCVVTQIKISQFLVTNQ